MTDQERILVAAGDSVASERAARYVAALIDARKDFFVRLLHVTPAMPPGMLECGGEESAEEVAEYESGYHQWVKRSEEEAWPIFDKLRKVLRVAGVAKDCIETETYTPKTGGIRRQRHHGNRAG